MLPARLPTVPRWVVRVCPLGFGSTAFSLSFVVAITIAMSAGAPLSVVWPAATGSAVMAIWAASLLWTLMALVFFDSAWSTHPARAIAFIFIRGVALTTVVPVLTPLLLGGAEDVDVWSRMLDRTTTLFASSFFFLLPFAGIAGARVRRARQV